MGWALLAHVYEIVTIDESNLAKCQAGLAQLVERKALNLVVMGSSPMAGVSYDVNCYIEL